MCSHKGFLNLDFSIKQACPSRGWHHGAATGPLTAAGALPCGEESCCSEKICCFHREKELQSLSKVSHTPFPKFPSPKRGARVCKEYAYRAVKLLPIKTKGGVGSPCSPSTRNLSVRFLAHHCHFGLLID